MGASFFISGKDSSFPFPIPTFNEETSSVSRRGFLFEELCN